MTQEEWNDIRHIVINGLLDIEYHRKHIADIMLSTPNGTEPNLEAKMTHLRAINNQIQSIENWLKLRWREYEANSN